MCTAQNLLQRFFYRKPLTKFDAFSVAMGCMLLAMKIEEDPRQPRAVVLVFHRMFERRMGVEPSVVIQPESLKALQDEMRRVELHVLKELGFGFYNIMDHPHKFILYYLRVLELENIEGDVSQRAWNYVNDSLRTDLSLRFRSEVIACAAIYMASRSLGIKLPDNPPWWVLFNADMQEMGKICNTILALYHRPKVAFLEPLCEKSVFRRGGPLRRDEVVEDIQETYAPADGLEEPAPTTPSEAQPADEPSTHEPVGLPAAVAEPVSNNSVCVTNSPEVPVPSDVHEPASNGTDERSTNQGQERASESRSESRSNRSHSTSRSAPGIERERERDRDRDREREDGVDREANGRLPERVQDRERDRKRPRERESRRSRSRSRSRSRGRRDRRADSRDERGRDRTRERDRERGRGKDWGRDSRDREKERSGDRDRDRDRRHDRGDTGRRSRR